MSPFIPTLFTIVLAETGGANMAITRALKQAEVAVASAVRGLAIVALIVVAFAAGAVMAFSQYDFMTARAAQLLLGIATFVAGAEHFFPLKSVKLAEGGTPQAVALRSYARRALASMSGLLVFAISLANGAGMDAVIGATLGGWLGLMIAGLPPTLLSRRQMHRLRFGFLRTLSGVILVIFAVISVLSALQLI